jgi:hypothetical protein
LLCPTQLFFASHIEFATKVKVYLNSIFLDLRVTFTDTVCEPKESAQVVLRSLALRRVQKPTLSKFLCEYVPELGPRAKHVEADRVSRSIAPAKGM